jgi:membrane protein DedA with SNARE-associated domain
VDSLVQHLITQFGYLAVFVGTFLEGETLLILGSLAAHNHLLDFPLVVVAGFVGELSGDILRFALGRRCGRSWIARWPKVAGEVQRATAYLDKYPNAFILSFRFIYGIRLIAPVAIALGRVSAIRFVLLATVSAAVWAPLIGALGFVFGRAIQAVFGKVERVEEGLIVVVVVIVLTFVIHRFMRRRVRHDGTGQVDGGSTE